MVYVQIRDHRATKADEDRVKIAFREFAETRGLSEQEAIRIYRDAQHELSGELVSIVRSAAVADWQDKTGPGRIYLQSPRLAGQSTYVYRRWTGEQFQRALAELGMSPELFGYIYGIRLGRIYDWLGGKEDIPASIPPYCAALSVPPAFQRALDMARHMEDGRRGPPREPDDKEGPGI